MEKRWMIILFVIVLSSLVLAQNKIQISQLKEEYSPQENITAVFSLFDSQNSEIKGNILLSVNSSNNLESFSYTAPANSPYQISIGTNPRPGFWKILAEYRDSGETASASALFMIKSNEIVKFEIIDGKLIITNIGNSLYSKEVQIAIGETIGMKKIENLAPGEAVTLRLLAPEGVYNIKVSDGTTDYSQNQVMLTGPTGEAIGILDEKAQDGSGITGGIGKRSFFNSTTVYIFLIVIFATAILLAIERKYRNKLGKIN